MGAWSDGLEQHCLEPVLYVIYTYNLSEGAIRLIGFILAYARFFSHGQTDRWTNGKTDGRIDRQTDGLRLYLHVFIEVKVCKKISHPRG